MPALKFSEKFYWLIHKQDESISIGMTEGINPIEMHMINSQDSLPISWVKTYFYIIPCDVPEAILKFNSPERNSGANST